MSENQNKTQDNSQNKFWQNWKKPLKKKEESETQKPVEDTQNALVDSIVKHAENANDKKTVGLAGERPVKLKEGTEETIESESVASNQLAFAKNIFASALIFLMVVFAASSIWLGDSNVILGLFDKENISTELSNEQSNLEKIEKDIVETQSYAKMLQAESLAMQIIDADFDSSAARFDPNSLVVQTDEEGNQHFIFTDETGERKEISETAARTLETRYLSEAQSLQETIREIVTLAEGIDSDVEIDSSVQKNLGLVVEQLAEIDVDAEDFPSAVDFNNFETAKIISEEILTDIKKINLKNLVADIKNQASSIQTDDLSEEEILEVEKVQNIAEKLGASLNGFNKAVDQIKEVNISAIEDPVAYKKVVQIIGEGDDDGDLNAGLLIARNLAPLTIVDLLKNDRIEWSTEIQRIEEIARLGSDGQLDDSAHASAGSNLDIDPDGQLIRFTGYSGRAEKDQIEAKGQVIGVGEYDQKNFTLLSDVADALEGSEYFKDVEGFSFSRNKTPEGVYYSPFSFALTFQDSRVEHPLDEEQNQIELEEVDTDAIDFSEKSESSEEEIQDEDSVVEEESGVEEDASENTTDEAVAEEESASRAR